MQAALFLPCSQGAETLLAHEVARITGRTVQAGRGGAWVEGDLLTAMQLNLESRIAQRVLWPLADGPYGDEQAIYELARRVPWAEWITPEQTLKVDVSAQRCPLKSLNFAALRVKDAVCDSLRESHGARPSVDTRRPTLPLVLFLGAERASLYADTSGEALFKRGWRDAQGGRQAVKGDAPLKETLAAAMLAAAGWHGREQDGPLLDPCCGAGTIAIEAAQLACGIAPGLRRHFAFERQRPFEPHLFAWREMRAAAKARVHAPLAPVFASDVSFRMTDFAARNAERAGVRAAIEIGTVDALQRLPPAPRGTLIVNPPYGERIEAKGQGAGTAAREGFDGGGDGGRFFAALAAHWKRHYPGWTAWVLSPEPQLPGLMRLKESRRTPMWNGGIECRLFRFDLVAGSHRQRANL